MFMLTDHDHKALVSTGLSTKKNAAISSTKDFSGNNLWGTSAIPIGGTLPLRGHHGKVHSLTHPIQINDSYTQEV